MAKLLIVDDDARLRRLVRTYGELDSHFCEEAADGQTALDKLGHGSFDLIILDVMMPGLDGFDVLEQIRKVSNIPVIMLTARNEAGTAAAGCLGLPLLRRQPHRGHSILNRSGTGSAHIGASSRPSGASAINLNIARKM